MPTLAFARAVGREAVDLVGCNAHYTLTIPRSNVLVDSISASAGALDPQTSPVKAIVRCTHSVVQRRHTVLNLGP